jgi:hypothetical protein
MRKLRKFWKLAKNGKMVKINQREFDTKGTASMHPNAYSLNKNPTKYKEEDQTHCEESQNPIFESK